MPSPDGIHLRSLKTVGGGLTPAIQNAGCEQSGYATTLRSLLFSSQVCGPRVHDARIAAICLNHAVAVLWAADRDYSRFPDLPTRNPLIAGQP